MTWEEAFAYVDSVLEAECAAQGITVRITDPEIIAKSVQLLRAGKANLEAKARSTVDWDGSPAQWPE